MTMRSITTVTVAPDETQLTTVARVKQELGITGTTYDTLLGHKIDEATSDIEAHIERTLARATLSQQFWGEGTGEYLVLDRTPVVSITSVTVDGVAVNTSEFRLDAEAGILYRLDSSGYPSFWSWCGTVVVVFVAGYAMPSETARDLPPALEAAAIELVNSYWQSRGRDPLVRAEDVPGLASVTYWVGAVGEEGQLPPGVTAKISPFRRALV